MSDAAPTYADPVLGALWAGVRVGLTVPIAVAAVERVPRSVAHDLRNQLNAVLVVAELLATGSIDTNSMEYHGFVTDLTTSARKMIILLNDLLTPGAACAQLHALVSVPQVPEPWPQREGEADNRPLVLVVEDNPRSTTWCANHVAVLPHRFGGGWGGGPGQGPGAAPGSRPQRSHEPRKDGAQLIRDMRVRPELDAIPFILLSAHGEDNLRLQVLRAGAQDYITKPFSSEELRARAANLISIKRTREVLQRALDTQSKDLEAIARQLVVHKDRLEGALAELQRANAELERSHAEPPFAPVAPVRPGG